MNLEVYQEPIMQIQGKYIEKELSCLEIEKNGLKAHRNMNCTNQKGHLYGKMAEDSDRELESTTSFYQNQILFYEKMLKEVGRQLCQQRESSVSWEKKMLIASIG